MDKLEFMERRSDIFLAHWRQEISTDKGVELLQKLYDKFIKENL